MNIPRIQPARFKVGKYDVEVRPLHGSAHMQLYTVRLEGKRIGAMASVPTESDCRFMEAPPKVPPLKPFVYSKPGRPKKGEVRPSAESLVTPREDVPADAMPDALRGRIGE